MVTTNLDAQRGIVWNMGAIAAKGDEAALKLFRDVLAASTAIPGLFPPVMIDVEVNGKKTQEMHADGGLAGQVFVAPESILNTSSTDETAGERALPDRQQPPDAGIPDHRALADLRARPFDRGRRAVDAADEHRPRLRDGEAQRRFPSTSPTRRSRADQQGKGAFDTEFMRGLFEHGVARGKSGQPFVQEVGEALRGPLTAGK